MRLFDGTAEYVRADEVNVGDLVRSEGEFRRVASTGRTENKTYQIRILFDDNHGVILPPESRVLRKIVKPA